MYNGWSLLYIFSVYFLKLVQPIFSKIRKMYFFICYFIGKVYFCRCKFIEKV